MPDYQLSKIYKIVCNVTGKIYYGSTTEPTLARRLVKHRCNFQSWKNGTSNYMSSFLIIENNDYNIILVEKYPCEDKMELLKRERFYIDNNECVNIVIPTQTMNEYRKKYDKIYRAKNHEKILEYEKMYRAKNYEKIKNSNYKCCEKHECICGGIYINKNKIKHEKTKKHLNYIANNNIDE